MLYTKQAAADNVRNRDGRRVFYLAAGDQLTCDARDYLRQERIEILPARQAGSAGGKDKPEYMTHLDAQTLVRKDHPRILFRGMLDALQGQLLLTQAASREPLRRDLGEILDLIRQILRCEVLEEPLVFSTLCGLDEEQLRRQSHRPQDYYGQPHFMPTAMDDPVILELNRLRTLTRQAELAAVSAFCDPQGNCRRLDILQAMNRLSSILYILMIRRKAGGREE